MSTYSERLKDPRWQKLRLEVMGRDKFTCQRCHDNTKTLHVHHDYYVSGRNPWEYPSETLTTLCVDCHDDSPDAVIRSFERFLVASRRVKGGADLLGCITHTLETIEVHPKLYYGPYMAITFQKCLAELFSALGIHDAKVVGPAILEALKQARSAPEW